MPAPARSRARAIAAEAGAVLFFLALAALATRPLVLHFATRTLAGGDPLVDLWTVDWLTEHFFEPARIFQGNIFHPAPHAVLYSDLSLGTAVLVLPLRLVLRDAVALYNAAVLLGFAFAGWAFHALVRALTGDRFAGLMAGVLAGFASHQVYHVYHLNLVSTGWLALFLLGLHGSISRPGFAPAALAGIAFALAAQTSGYYAVAAVLLALVFAAGHAPELRERRVLATLAGAAAFGALLVAPYALAYTTLGLRRPVGMSVQMAFVPARDLTSIAYVHRAWLGNGGEALFPGALPLGLALVALVRRAPRSGFYAAAAAVLILVSLGPRLEAGGRAWTLPYSWLFAIPPLDGMRHPYTFAAVACLLLAVLAGLGWATLPLSRRRAAAVAVVILAVMETLAPGPHLQALPRRLPPVYGELAALPPGPVLELPVFAEETLLWAARHGRPVLNGQGSAFVPLDTLRLNRLVENHWLREPPTDVDASKPTPVLVRRFPVRYVILPVGRKPEFAGLAAAFDASRVFRPRATAGDGDRIYEVRPEALPDRGQEGEDLRDLLGDDGEPIGHQ